jgi:transcriptional regulator with XRE-family HTH domain
LLNAIVEQFPGRKARFAREIGVSPSVLSRLLSGKRPPSIEECLAIAKAGGTAASLLLRNAGYDAVAALLEELYGPPRVVVRELSGDQVALVRAFEQYPKKVRRHLLAVIEFGAIQPEAAAALVSTARRANPEHADKRSA